MGIDLKMPVARDVRVSKEAASEGEPSRSVDQSPAKSKASPSLVTVMGFDKTDVLFRSNDVGAVQWRGSDGTIVAILVRLRPDVWGFSRVGDDDWDEVLKLYGNADEGK